ncbi:MAG TPA: hypothetical protein VNP72_04835 [Longimicrobium sp.]|nr:hypothetical protein [Longimicrobium sp.]
MHSRSTLRAAALLVAGLATLAACADGHPVASARGGAAAPTDGPALARILAGGLADPAVRAGVRDALRDSEMNEHKLVLQSFVRTPAGSALVHTSAARAGMADRALLAAIARLGQTDFYVPVPAHRQTWKATADVVVGFTADIDSPLLTAFGTDGGSIQLDSRSGAPAQPLLLLHAAETKWKRANAGVHHAGAVIEASGGGSLMNMLPEDGAGCDPQTAITMCDTETSGGEPGGTGGTGTTTSGQTLDRFISYPGDGWGDSEVQFTHFYYNYTGTRINVWQRVHGNTEEDQWSYPHWPTTISAWVGVIELDSGGTLNDDHWGEAQIGPSGTQTLVYSECVTVFRDGFGILNCGLPPQPILTTRIVYIY